MKKFFTIIAAALMAITASAATTTVGAEDNSAGWWSAFSDYYTVGVGQKAHITFKNYSDKQKNWNNWLIVFTPVGAQRDVEGYSEYGVIRLDNWGWGKNIGHNTSDENLLEGVSIVNDYNWDTLLDDMDGSSVVMDVYNTDGIIYGSAVITTTAGKEYHYSYNTNNTGAKDFGFFLTVEKAHLTDVTVTTSGEAAAISTVKTNDNLSDGKFIQNGRLVIVKNGCEYNAAGAMLK